ncbi:hypothetical protein AGLY_016688 [Aphis glycines]|uniref:BED-type domain-containing protein n=1 Tax=Aphis glycines TaxID=307491 RepID=A0A6G0SYZ5_APHGL|nr:hypothetical protein AGLY_016688 [Aphis glycines]
MSSSSDEGPKLGSKKKPYTPKFKEEWKKHPEFASWLCKGKTDTFCHCNVCFYDYLGGLSAIKRHSKSDKHKNNSKSVSVSNPINKMQKFVQHTSNCYHYLCEGITEAAFNKQFKNTRSRWICNKCKLNWDKPKNISSKSTDSEISQQELANSMNFISQQFDDFRTTVTKILEEMKEIRKKNVRIVNDNIKLTQEIFDLKYLALNLLSK